MVAIVPEVIVTLTIALTKTAGMLQSDCCVTGNEVDVLWYCVVTKTVAVLTAPPSYHVQSAGDAARQMGTVFYSQMTSGATLPHTQPVRFTAAHNAVLLGAYGLTPAHSAPSGLPVTLHPILQAVDTRQVAERLASFLMIHLAQITQFRLPQMTYCIDQPNDIFYSFTVSLPFL